MSFTARTTGGEYTHKLTAAEMPSHIHYIHSKWDGSKETDILNWAVPMVEDGFKMVCQQVVINTIIISNHTLQHIFGREPLN